MKILTYRHKPNILRAVRFNGENQEDILRFWRVSDVVCKPTKCPRCRAAFAARCISEDSFGKHFHVSGYPDLDVTNAIVPSDDFKTDLACLDEGGNPCTAFSANLDRYYDLVDEKEGP